MKSIYSEHIKKLLKKVRIVSLYRLNYLYLKDSGWLASTKVSMPVDSKGKELPWFIMETAWEYGFWNRCSCGRVKA